MYFTGKKCSILLSDDPVDIAFMTEWTLSFEGERIDISDYDSPSFKGTTGMATASIDMKGPYPLYNFRVGYWLRPGEVITVRFYLDTTAAIAPFKLRVLVDKLELNTTVKGLVECSISGVVIENVLDGDTNTEAILI